MPGEPAGIINYVSALLESETNPMSRHYLWAQAEDSLYALRDSAGALDLYDQACMAHDQEMQSIAPSLIDVFGGLPLLEVYKQSSIRHQKAHDWQLQSGGPRAVCRSTERKRLIRPMSMISANASLRTTSVSKRPLRASRGTRRSRLPRSRVWRTSNVALPELRPDLAASPYPRPPACPLPGLPSASLRRCSRGTSRGNA